MNDTLRTVRLSPYRKGTGPRFTLTLWDTGRTVNGKFRLGYRLRQHSSGGAAHHTLFEGEDFLCSQMHAINSDATVAAIIGFLTLKPGDTDGEYFDTYTPDQMQFAELHAEALAIESMERFES